MNPDEPAAESFARALGAFDGLTVGKPGETDQKILTIVTSHGSHTRITAEGLSVLLPRRRVPFRYVPSLAPQLVATLRLHAPSCSFARPFEIDEATLSLGSYLVAMGRGGSGSLGPPTPSSSIVAARRLAPRPPRFPIRSRRGAQPRSSSLDSNRPVLARAAASFPSDFDCSKRFSFARRAGGRSGSPGWTSRGRRWKRCGEWDDASVTTTAAISRRGGAPTSLFLPISFRLRGKSRRRREGDLERTRHAYAPSHLGGAQFDRLASVFAVCSCEAGEEIGFVGHRELGWLDERRTEPEVLEAPERGRRETIVVFDVGPIDTLEVAVTELCRRVEGRRLEHRGPRRELGHRYTMVVGGRAVERASGRGESAVSVVRCRRWRVVRAATHDCHQAEHPGSHRASPM